MSGALLLGSLPKRTCCFSEKRREPRLKVGGAAAACHSLSPVARGTHCCNRRARKFAAKKIASTAVKTEFLGLELLRLQQVSAFFTVNFCVN